MNIEKVKTNICAIILYRLNITLKGEVLPCSRIEALFKAGDINNMSLVQALNSSLVNDLRIRNILNKKLNLSNVIIVRIL